MHQTNAHTTCGVARQSWLCDKQKGELSPACCSPSNQHRDCYFLEGAEKKEKTAMTPKRHSYQPQQRRRRRRQQQQAQSPAVSPPSEASTSESLNSQMLAWDQTYLRITYLVRTMAAPVRAGSGGAAAAAAASSSASATASPGDWSTSLGVDRHAHGSGCTCECDGAANDVDVETGAQDRDEQNAHHLLEPGARGWPAVPRDKVRRKIMQIEVWRSEVAEHGSEAFCGCSEARVGGSGRSGTFPLRRAESGGSYKGKHAVVESGDGGAAGAPTASMGGRPCEMCLRPPTPAITPELDDMQGSVMRAINGIKELVKRRRSSRDRAKAAATTAAEPTYNANSVGNPGAAYIMRTEMYRADIPQPQPDAPSPAGRTPQSRPAGDDNDDSADPDLDLEDLSGSNSPDRGRGLLERNARLRRAQKLLQRSLTQSHSPDGETAGRGEKAGPVAGPASAAAAPCRSRGSQARPGGRTGAFARFLS